MGPSNRPQNRLAFSLAQPTIMGQFLRKRPSFFNPDEVISELYSTLLAASNSTGRQAERAQQWPRRPPRRPSSSSCRASSCRCVRLSPPRRPGRRRLAAAAASRSCSSRAAAGRPLLLALLIQGRERRRRAATRRPRRRSWRAGRHQGTTRGRDGRRQEGRRCSGRAGRRQGIGGNAGCSEGSASRCGGEEEAVIVRRAQGRRARRPSGGSGEAQGEQGRARRPRAAGRWPEARARRLRRNHPRCSSLLFAAVVAVAQGDEGASEREDPRSENPRRSISTKYTRSSSTSSITS
jgi:hypothetical protein